MVQIYKPNSVGKQPLIDFKNTAGDKIKNGWIDKAFYGQSSKRIRIKRRWCKSQPNYTLDVSGNINANK